MSRAAVAALQRKQAGTGLDHLYGFQTLRDEDSCVAFGSFDGLHIGHRAVIDRMAEHPGLRKTLLSFEDPDRPVFLTESEKAFLLKDSSVDCLVSVPMDQIGQCEPRDFIQKILIGKMHARVIVAGEDSCFFDELLSLSRSGAFRLVSVPPVGHDGSPVSAERLCRCLDKGSFAGILELLGHSYVIQGTVTHGKGIGRTQGMPTANLRLPASKILPPYGVYGSVVHLKDGVRTGLTNIGPRPSVDSMPAPTVETYILDFDGDLYGEELTLEVREWVRGIVKFEGGLREVTEQVGRDIEYVRSVMRG